MTGVSFAGADQRFNDRRQRRIDHDHLAVDVHVRGARREARLAAAAAGHHNLEPALRHRRAVHRQLDQARSAVERLRDAPPMRGFWGVDMIRGVEATRHDAQLADAVHDTTVAAAPVTRLRNAVERAREVRTNRIRRLDSYLRSKGSPMAGQGATFYRVGREFGIDPRFLIAIAGQESVFGTRNSARYNAFGYFGTNGGPSSFGSWEQAIRRVAWQLSGPVYMGDRDYPKDSVYAIGSTWAPVGAGNDPNDLNSNWPGGVQHYMDEQGAHNYEVTWRGYVEDVSPRRY